MSWFFVFLCFFFFKQKTAYEMRISDWSSDVCSSDLEQGRAATLDADAEQLGVYVFKGTASIDGREVREGNLALLGPGGQVEIVASDDRPAEVMLLGGPAMDAPIVRSGDRRSVVSGQRVPVRVDLGCGRFIKKKKQTSF